ncbi:MAG TPA: hypothetical protein VF026_00810 [Ktedonobacteraceae bacterium]
MQEPIPVAPLRTKRDRFRITSLSSGPSCCPKAASDAQRILALRITRTAMLLLV